MCMQLVTRSVHGIKEPVFPERTPYRPSENFLEKQNWAGNLKRRSPGVIFCTFLMWCDLHCLKKSFSKKKMKKTFLFHLFMTSTVLSMHQIFFFHVSWGWFSEKRNYGHNSSYDKLLLNSGFTCKTLDFWQN